MSAEESVAVVRRMIKHGMGGGDPGAIGTSYADDCLSVMQQPGIVPAPPRAEAAKPEG